MSANEEVRDCSPMLTLLEEQGMIKVPQVEETLSKLFTLERRLLEEKAEGEKREATARQV